MDRSLAIYPTAHKVEDVLRRASATACAWDHRVFTFPQLVRRLWRECRDGRAALEAPGERLIVEEALRAAPDLGLRPVPGLIDHLHGLIRQFKSAALRPADLGDAMSALGNPGRLSAVVAIFGAYEAALARHRLADAHDRESAVLRMLHEAERTGIRPAPLDGIARLTVAEIYDFSLLQFMIVTSLTRLIGDAVVTIQASGRSVDATRFADLTWNRFVAEESIADQMLPDFVRRDGRPGALGFVLEHLFAAPADAPPPPDATLEIVRAPSRLDEVEYVAHEIRRELEKPGGVAPARVAWNFQSDWKPEPNTNFGGTPKSTGLSGWEPVFHAALWNGYVFVPGWGGTVYKLNESDGTVVAQYNPNGSTIDPNAYVSGPLTVDSNGNVYYNVVALDPIKPWSVDIPDAWLVKITPQGTLKKASYKVLVPGANTKCFDGTTPCGSQRAGINVGPAISADGSTIYIATRAHLEVGFELSYVIAVNSDLTPAWQALLRNFVSKGIAGFILDEASSSPVVVPDGSVLFGVISSTLYSQMIKLSSTGQYLASFDFGWDDTPAVYAHDGTYSVITKDNNLGPVGPFFIIQLNSNLEPEWSFKDPTSNQDHPHGLEWCVNAPAVDANGTVYADNEDGSLYAINQGGTLKGNVFLQESIGAAYTPVSIGRDGKIYTENDGQMFVLGNSSDK